MSIGLLKTKLCWAIIGIFVICSSCRRLEKDTKDSKNSTQTSATKIETEVSTAETDQYIISTKIEEYIGLSKDEILDALGQYGFYEEDNTVTNGIEDADGVSFQFDEKGNLKNIVVFDFNGTSEWNFCGISCANTPEECRTQLEKLGATFVGHNQMETASGIGLQNKGIKNIKYGLDKNIGYLDIDIDYTYFDWLDCKEYSIEETEVENIICPQFCSDNNSDYFSGVNEAIKNKVLDNLELFEGKDIQYMIECQEINNISVSFYGEEHYEPIVAFNYDLEKNEEIINCPYKYADESVKKWLVNPMFYIIINNEESEDGIKYEWRY